MQRHLARTLTTLALVGAMLGVVAPAAQAATAPAPASVNMTFAAGSGPVLQGAPVSLNGRVWLKQTGNRSRVEFYFQRMHTTAWVYAGFVNSTDRGNYVKRTTAQFSGTWKVVYRGTATRRGTARVSALQVAKLAPRQIVTYRGTTADWQSPVIRIPSANYQARVTYNCTHPTRGYMAFSWNGEANGYEEVVSSRVSGTLTLNGHRGARNGYFVIDTWTNCSWSAQVFSGSSRVTV